MLHYAGCHSGASASAKPLDNPHSHNTMITLKYVQRHVCAIGSAWRVWSIGRHLVMTALPIVASCAIIHHDSPPAALIRPEAVRLADTIHLAGEGWPSAQWWTQYDDPQLNSLIGLALSHAPTLIIARERLSQASAQVELIQAASTLQISSRADVDRQHVSDHGFTSAYASHDPAIGAYGPSYWSGLVGLDGHYDIDVWGKQRDQVRAAIGEQSAQRAEAAQVQLELAVSVAQLYYTIQTTYASLALLQQLRDIRVVERDAHSEQYGRGLEALTQTQGARAQLLAVEQTIEATKAQAVHAREALRALLGLGADALPEILSAPLPTRIATLPSTLSYELLARRPDLQAMRWLVEASFDRIAAAKAAFYPSFDIVAFFGFDALRLRDLFLHSSQQINLIPGLTLPIFDGGRLNANLHGARTESNTLIAQYNQAVLNAVRDVAQRGSELDDLDRRLALQHERIEAMGFVGASAEANYHAGLSDRPTAMQAQAPLIEARLQLVQLSGDELEMSFSLIMALGGGYRNSGFPDGDARSTNAVRTPAR
jgi:multidrug efflux system outer membrane protein